MNDAREARARVTVMYGSSGIQDGFRYGESENDGSLSACSNQIRSPSMMGR